jgi:hypothetical protein
MNATKTTTTEPGQPFYLPMHAVDDGEALCTQLRSIMSCVGAASESRDITDTDVINACQGAMRLVDALHEIVAMRVAANATGIKDARAA